MRKMLILTLLLSQQLLAMLPVVQKEHTAASENSVTESDEACIERTKQMGLKNKALCDLSGSLGIDEITSYWRDEKTILSLLRETAVSRGKIARLALTDYQQRIEWYKQIAQINIALTMLARDSYSYAPVTHIALSHDGSLLALLKKERQFWQYTEPINYDRTIIVKQLPSHESSSARLLSTTSIPDYFDDVGAIGFNTQGTKLVIHTSTFNNYLKLTLEKAEKTSAHCNSLANSWLEAPTATNHMNRKPLQFFHDSKTGADYCFYENDEDTDKAIAGKKEIPLPLTETEKMDDSKDTLYQRGTFTGFTFGKGYMPK